MPKNKLTDKERKSLQAYLDEMETLAAAEPEYNFGIPDSVAAWEKWNAEAIELNNKYRDVIIKALAESFDDWKDDPPGVAEILRAFMSDEKAVAMHAQLALIKRYGLMNDKTNRAIISDPGAPREIDGQLKFLWAVDQAAKGREAVPAYISLSYEGEKITTSRRITGKDDTIFTAVANIIHSLRQHGAPAPYNVTPDDIWRTMHGITDATKRPSEKQRKEICDSLDKMRFTRLYMDISAEINEHNLQIDDDRLTGGRFDGYYLPAEKVTFFTEKGRQLEGYQFLQTPFLNAYNMAKGNIVLVDYALLDTSDTTGNEGDTAQFRLYLLREIALMYKGWRNSNRILYDTLYQAAAIPSPEESTDRSDYKSDNSYNAVIRRKAKDDRDKVAALLDSWVNKKYILGYTPVKKGRAIVGVDIELNPKNYEKKKPALAKKDTVK